MSIRLRRAHPRIEPLEDRTMLSTCHVTRLSDAGIGMGFRGDFRFCIDKVNANPGADVIDFHVTGTINLTGPLPDLASDIDIQGPGSGLLTVRRDAGGDYRLFTIADGSVQISGLSLTNGRADVGGAVYNQGGLTLAGVTLTTNESTAGQGGGIYNAGDLTLTDSVLDQNSVNVSASLGSGFGAGLYNAPGALADLIRISVSENTALGVDVYGAGIANYGTMTLPDSTVLDNTGRGCEGWQGGSYCFVYGGGVANFGTMEIISSAVSDNLARTLTDSIDDWGQSYGGGIHNSGSLNLTSSTVAGNRVEGERYAKGGGIANFGSLDIESSTIADNVLGGAWPFAYGAGIFHDGPSTLNVISSTISGNHIVFSASPGWGGGIYAKGNVTVRDSTISDNLCQGCTSGLYAGGIYVSSTGYLWNTTITGNFAYDGAGIYNVGTLTIDNVVISGNSATSSNTARGGGIFNGGDLTITGSLISENFARGTDTGANGGGIYNSGTLTLIDSTVDANNVTADVPQGGGLYNSGSALVKNTTISNNAANETKPFNLGKAGGIYNRGDLLLNNSTVHGNQCIGSSQNLGGGMFVDGPALTLISQSTISGNQCQKGGGLFVAFGSEVYVRNSIFANSAGSHPDVSGLLTSSDHNLIQNTTGGSGFGSNDILNVDPMLGSFGDNGGPTLTVALLPGSPAIDAGNNTDVPEWDQRGPGFPRIVNGTIDIGAFEVQASPIPGPDQNWSVLLTADLQKKK